MTAASKKIADNNEEPNYNRFIFNDGVRTGERLRDE